MYIALKDEVTYSLELTYCDGSDPTIVSATQCAVPVSTLRAEPFELEWGAHVYTKVVAINVYGASIESEIGNGAIIITNPDAPMNLLEDSTYRDSSTLGLKWDEGFQDGGNTITQFVLSMKEEGGSYSVIQSGLSVPVGQTTVSGLTFGTTYIFKVQASNDFGLSEDSTELSLLCAYIPVAPAAPTTVVLLD